MNAHDPIPRLRIGMIGSGFIANFHLQALVSVRHVTVAGIYSPNAAHREALAAKANALELGPCRAFPTLEAMLISGEVDAVWIGVPNFARLETMREKFINSSHRAGRSSSASPARSRSRARWRKRARCCGSPKTPACSRLSGEPGLFHRGAARQGHRLAARGADRRPALPRARRRGAQRPAHALVLAGRLQGGGVLTDMMCHSVEVGALPADRAGRAARRSEARQRQRHSRRPEMDATRIRQAAERRDGCRDGNARRRRISRAARSPCVDPDGHEVIVEATTSWAYVGAGLRIPLELLGPGVLDGVLLAQSGLKTFFSRAMCAAATARIWSRSRMPSRASMPVVENEAGILRLCRREPPHGRCLPPSAPADRDFP